MPFYYNNFYLSSHNTCFNNDFTISKLCFSFSLYFIQINCLSACSLRRISDGRSFCVLNKPIPCSNRSTELPTCRSAIMLDNRKYTSSQHGMKLRQSFYTHIKSLKYRMKGFICKFYHSPYFQTLKSVIDIGYKLESVSFLRTNE